MEIKHFSFARANCLTPIYVDIAAKNFVQAEKLLEKFDEYIQDSSLHDEEFPYSDIFQCVISTIIFSALAAESFINNYACKILGDEIFKENFESLRVDSKLQLCHKVVTGKAIDTGNSICWSLLKQLTKRRNDFVHNKSFEISGMSDEECREYDNVVENGCIEETSYEDILKDFFVELKEDLRNAYDALRAVFELAKPIDAIDNMMYAEWHLFVSDNGCGSSGQLDRVRRMLRTSGKLSALHLHKK